MLERERLAERARQARQLSPEGNAIRTALLAAVSHDLRTPLASIKAASSSLRSTDVEWSATDEAALLATIEESADRLDALVANLLDMSRLQTGSVEPHLRPVDLDEIVPTALSGLPPSALVELNVAEELPLVVADPGLLERVLANLVENAVRHGGEGRPVWSRPVRSANGSSCGSSTAARESPTPRRRRFSALPTTRRRPRGGRRGPRARGGPGVHRRPGRHPDGRGHPRAADSPWCSHCPPPRRPWLPNR